MAEEGITQGDLIEESAQKWVADITSIERDYFAEVEKARAELDQAEDNLKAAKKAERDAYNAFIGRMKPINEQYRARCLQAAKLRSRHAKHPDDILVAANRFIRGYVGRMDGNPMFTADNARRLVIQEKQKREEYERQPKDIPIMLWTI